MTSHLHWNRADYMAYWPRAQPYPYSIGRSQGWVPNQQSVDGAQAQFAPLYLPPGSASFQPYSYTKNDVTLASQQPAYRVDLEPALLPRSMTWPPSGPGGDRAAIHRMGPRPAPLLDQLGGIDQGAIPQAPRLVGYYDYDGPKEPAAHRMGMRPAQQNPVGYVSHSARTNGCAPCNARRNPGEGVGAFLALGAALVAGLWVTGNLPKV